MMKRIKSDPSLFLLPSVFFLCVPVFFVSLNIGDIESLDLRAFFVLAALAMLTTLIILSILALLKPLKLDGWASRLVEFVFFFIVLTGFVLPVSKSTGMLDPSQFPIDFVNLTIALCLAAVLSFVSASRHRKVLYAVLLVYMGLNTTIAGYEVIAKYAGGQKLPETLHQASSERNIFVLSLDGIPGTIAKEVLDENESIRRKFDGFTIFSRVAASSPATSASIVATLYGNRNFKEDFQTEAELWDSRPDALLTNFLNENGYLVSTYGVYARNFEAPERGYSSVHVRPLSLAALVNFSIARTVTSTFTLPAGSLNDLEFWVQDTFFEGSQAPQLLLQIENSNAPDWKSEESPSIIDLDDYLQNLHVATSGPVAHFSHFTFSHFPVEFDRNCQYMGSQKAWYQMHQNGYGAKEETYCTLSKFAQFVDKLKALGIFDQSLIILKSDHGKPVFYNDPRTIESATINGHALWGLGRYAPFLAIKNFGPGSFGLRENRSPVMLDDLALTICDSALGEGQCSAYPGFDLLDNDLSIPDQATATVFIVQSRFSDFKFDTHEAVTVRRQPDILENLYKTTRR